MNLTFDNLAELDEFLSWANRYGTRRDTFTAGDGSAPDLEARDLQVGPYAAQGSLPAGGVAFDTPQRALKGNHVALMDGSQPGGGHIVPSGASPADLAKQADAEKSPEQPATRKRRTKAEIAADEKAAAANAGADLKAAAAGLVQDADKAAEPAAQPGGTNPFEQVATAGDGPAEGVIAGRVAGAFEEPGEEVVTPFLHLTRAREFIAKHGMPKYNETFAKAGLDPNVMGYNAEQRAQHMTALAELDKA